jgi:hypothetical protein
VAEDLRLADAQEMLTARANEVPGREVITPRLTAEPGRVTGQLGGRERSATAERDEQCDQGEYKRRLRQTKLHDNPPNFEIWSDGREVRRGESSS